MPRLRPALPWLVWSAIAIPVTTVLHELAHLLAYHAAGVPEVVLHFNTVDGASANHPAWALALGAAGGPLMTLLIVISSVVGAWRLGPSAGVVAIGLVAPFRTFVPASWLVIHTLWGRANNANFDELNAARALGWPGQPLMLVEIAIVVAALTWLARAIPREERAGALLGTFAGGGLGILVWWTLGPLLLP